MKKLKLGIGTLLLTFAAIGGVNAYNLFTFDPKDELEQDLKMLAVDLQDLHADRKFYEEMLNQVNSRIESKEAMAHHKTCTLAMVKKEQGLPVSHRTKERCEMNEESVQTNQEARQVGSTSGRQLDFSWAR